MKYDSLNRAMRRAVYRVIYEAVEQAIDVAVDVAASNVVYKDGYEEVYWVADEAVYRDVARAVVRARFAPLPHPGLGLYLGAVGG